MNKLFSKSCLDWGIVFSLFFLPNFLQMKREIPFQTPWRWGESLISLWFGGDVSVSVSSSSCPETAGLSWELKKRAMVRGTAEKKTKAKPSLAFQFSEGCFWSISRKNILWSGKEVWDLCKKFHPQEKLFLYISMLWISVDYHLLPRWANAPLLCSLNT